MTRELPKRRFRLPASLAEYVGMLAALGLLVLVFSLVTKRFFSLTTFRSIANEYSEYFVVAVGMTFVLVIAGIDLSVGSVMALSGAVLGVGIARWGLPVPVAVAVGLGVGLCCGVINGLVTIAWDLPPFIVTLGMLEAARGATYLVTNETQYIGGRIGVVAEAGLSGWSVPFLIAAAVVVVAQLVLSRTVFGRHAVAIGTNEEAVRLSGIDPRGVKLIVFALSGLLAGVGAVFRVSRMQAADPNTGVGFELEAIAAVVIGGTSLMGGRGSVVRSFFGVLIIAVLSNGFFQVGATHQTRRVVTGAVIVAAVILDHYRQRLRGGRGLWELLGRAGDWLGKIGRRGADDSSSAGPTDNRGGTDE